MSSGFLSEPAKPARSDVQVNLGSPALDRKLTEGLKHLSDNPSLLVYKLKTNGYKFSWALIPLSLPFVWLLFFWRRDIHLYDHAIFVTYSISFMMLLVVLASVASMFGVPRERRAARLPPPAGAASRSEWS